MEELDLIKTLLEKVGARDINIYDLKQTHPLYDTVVVATADSVRQAEAFASYIKEESKQGLEVKNVEGKDTGWLLIDLNGIIIHVFTPEDRQFFNLDRLYTIGSEELEDE